MIKVIPKDNEKESSFRLNSVVIKNENDEGDEENYDLGDDTNGGNEVFFTFDDDDDIKKTSLISYKNMILEK